MKKFFIVLIAESLINLKKNINFCIIFMKLKKTMILLFIN